MTLGEAVAQTLVGASHPPPPDKNLTTWIDGFCNTLRDRLEDLDPPRMRWLVIDNFGRVAAEESCFDLLATLSMRSYVDLRTLRLVLLSYRDREWLQARVTGIVEYEKIAAIGRDDLLRFFGQLYLEDTRRRGEAIENEKLAPRVRASVNRVLSAVPASGARRLETLGRAVWNEANGILNPPPIDGALDDLVNEAGKD